MKLADQWCNMLDDPVVSSYAFHSFCVERRADIVSALRMVESLETGVGRLVPMPAPERPHPELIAAVLMAGLLANTNHSGSIETYADDAIRAAECLNAAKARQAYARRPE